MVGLGVGDFIGLILGDGEGRVTVITAKLFLKRQHSNTLKKYIIP